ncbi:hypothetical protein [Solicola sp. PLA-1-18]|uniref:hypothetical protein n=1 Tax=Solicola sp. PLA-1-18 TaxID=3380532 RepID=UPI003B792462
MSDGLVRCIWCGDPATTREHRFKKTQLNRMLQESSHLIFEGGDHPTRINGARASAMKFPMSLCATCNNVRSQPFDQAYDDFAAFVWDNPEYFRAAAIDWASVLAGGIERASDLCAYYVKNFMCRIAETGHSVPTELVDFLNREGPMPNATIVPYKDFTGYDTWRALGLSAHGSQHPYANRMFSPHLTGDRPLDAFVCELQDGPVGVMFWWDRHTETGINSFFQDRAPLRDRRDLPYPELHEPYWATYTHLGGQ